VRFSILSLFTRRELNLAKRDPYLRDALLAQLDDAESFGEDGEQYQRDELEEHERVRRQYDLGMRRAI
jgi:hypothetical protein